MTQDRGSYFINLLDNKKKYNDLLSLLSSLARDVKFIVIKQIRHLYRSQVLRINSRTTITIQPSVLNSYFLSRLT